MTRAAAPALSIAKLAPTLDRRFEAVVFDWDGTAVPDRRADPARLRRLVLELSANGLDLAVVSGTPVRDVDDRLAARPSGPGRLFLCVNHGSEVFEATSEGLQLLFRREATPAESEGLDAAAAATLAELERRGLETQIVGAQLNRRKIDLIPLPEWSEPPRARIAELVEAVQGRLRRADLAGLREAVEIGSAAARAAGLPDPRVASDAKHVEIGLTDKSDAARWIFADLWKRGIAPSLVLVAGDEFGPFGGLEGSDSHLLVPETGAATVISVGAEPNGAPAQVLELGGGPALFARVLADQLKRRRRTDVPDVGREPGWNLVVEPADPRLQRVEASLLTLADGRLGTRGEPLGGPRDGTPAVLYSGVYTGKGPSTELAPCPDWTDLGGRKQQRVTRTLDLRAGLLHEDGPRSSLRLSSLARPGTVAVRLRTSGARSHARPLDTGTVAAVARDRQRGGHLERVGAYDPDPGRAEAAAADAAAAGFDGLLREHRERWAERWDGADVVVEGDPELQLAIRFALFHLIGSVADTGEAAVGARGLTGPAYRGHVFWDSDVFVLPFAAATHPQGARAMLEYRLRRLPAALVAARRLGRSGARFPWESAADGFDVTPASARLASGELVRIRTGELEEHIVGDVAWAAACYVDWTGDTAFEAGPGRELFVETARYWASRVRHDSAGRAHIYGAIGPDEYHEPVDDNAFTNVLARWNLRRAAALPGVPDVERRAWLEVADALVDGYDRASGIYEQFSGFFDLEPLVIEEVAPRRPIAADLLLGAERTRGAQVLKQPDVLMLHHLLPDEVAPGSLVPNLDFYEPRTAHGSSLSPAINASVLARAGRYRPALDALRLAARMDLDDLSGSTAGGLHLATMGGLWQAIVFGFGGIRPAGAALRVEPRLPPGWNALEPRLCFHGRPLCLRVDRHGVATDSTGWRIDEHDTHWEVVPE
jgi:trehalose/maltose hydrolase-like predicted phosphorylase